MSSTLRIVRPLGCLGVVGCVAVILAGCNNAGQGALSGAAIGSLGGLAIGSLSGDAGKGAAIGAIAGAIGGAVIGDQNKRKEQEAQQAAPQPVYAPPPQPVTVVYSQPAPVVISHSQLTDIDRQRMMLSQLTGSWNVNGWTQHRNGQREFASGTAMGFVEQNYFLNLSISVAINNQPGNQASGTVVLGADPGTGMTMTSRFSTAPGEARFVGAADVNAKVVTVLETVPQVQGIQRKIVIRMLNGNQWVMNVYNIAAPMSPQIGEFTFTRTS